MKKCKTIMTREPITCLAGDTIETAAGRMRSANVGALPVVDGEEAWLVGIVTDRDIAIRASARGLDPRTTRVGEVMTREVFTCLPDDPIDKAVERMEEHQVRRLPIVDDDGLLVGIIAQADLATRVHDPALVAEFLEEISEPVAEAASR